MKSSTSTLALVLTAALGGAVAHASDNPFALSPLSQGYGVAATDKAQDGKCGEGKCGAIKAAKPQDGKKPVIKDAKAKDGKCGEGKCGSKK